MTNFILILFCISTGMLMSRLNILPKDAHKGINAWILYIALPALSLRFVPEIQFNPGIWLPVIGPFLVWGGAWLYVRTYDRKKKLSVASRTALLVTCGLGNTAFLGFPMTAAFFGESEIHNAVIFDQVTFFIFATLGVITVLGASAEKTGDLTFPQIAKRLLRFPPFIACIVALILPRFTDISFANPFLDKLVATLTPLALFSLGSQLKIGKIKQEGRLLTAGIAYKLILAPALVLVLALMLHSSGNLAKISVFEAGMSPHLTVSILASQNNLNPNYCSLVIGLSIIIGFITSAAWYFVLQGVL